MAYRDDIAALGADHLWRMDGDGSDDIGTNTLTSSDGTFTTNNPVCEDATGSWLSDSTSDRLTASTSSDIDGALDRKIVCGWFTVDSIQLPPKSVYREGDTGNQFNLVLWAGNNLMLDVVNNGTVVQAFSDRVLSPGRQFHITAKVHGTGYDNTVALYLDGVLQSITEPVNGELGAATLGSRSAAQWSDPSGSTEVGNEAVLLNGLVEGRYNFWATFSGANAELTDTEIREELFEKGALPDVTISSDSEANMQLALDALADTVRPDAPLAIRVEPVSGGGNLSLSADNITFDPRASIHVQYTGTDILTWTNTNGSNASIGSTPNGGTLNFVTPATLTVAGLQPNTEVRYYESGTQTELAGVENSSTSFSSSVDASSVDVVIVSLNYEIKRVNAVDMTSGDVTLLASQVLDRNYENP